MWTAKARCRYHTDPETLNLIRRTARILPSGELRGPVAGVHVELQPFGPVNPLKPWASAAALVGAGRRGAYVEFDVPPGCVVLRTTVGPLRTGIIPTPTDRTPLPLAGLNPSYVTVRWWYVWRWFS